MRTWRFYVIPALLIGLNVASFTDAAAGGYFGSYWADALGCAIIIIAMPCFFFACGYHAGTTPENPDQETNEQRTIEIAGPPAT